MITFIHRFATFSGANHKLSIYVYIHTCVIYGFYSRFQGQSPAIIFLTSAFCKQAFRPKFFVRLQGAQLFVFESICYSAEFYCLPPIVVPQSGGKYSVLRPSFRHSLLTCRCSTFTNAYPLTPESSPLALYSRFPLFDSDPWRFNNPGGSAPCSSLSASIVSSWLLDALLPCRLPLAQSELMY